MRLSKSARAICHVIENMLFVPHETGEALRHKITSGKNHPQRTGENIIFDFGKTTGGIVMNNENETEELQEMMHEEMERRFSRADEKSMGMIEEYVAGGFCETLARLAVYLGKERAEKALGKLPEEIRAEIERRIDALDNKTRTDQKIILEAEQVFQKTDFCGKAMADSVIEGAGQKVLATLYHESDALFTRNPVLATNIEKYIFRFEDIVRLSDRDTQKMLREVDVTTLAKALQGNNTKKVWKKVCRLMSKRAAKRQKEEIKFLGPVPVHEVDAAQNKILEVIRRLEKSGDIVIARFE